MSRHNNYTMRFNFTGFIGSRVIEAEDQDGNLERGVFIPIERNALYEDPKTKHVMCEAFVNSREITAYDAKTHYIKQKTSVAHVAKINEQGYKIPTLGSLWLNVRYAPSFQSANRDVGRVKFNQNEIDE